MSLEQALAENTAALREVAELLKISNADRAKLLAAGGAAPVTVATPSASAPSGDTDMTVAEIKVAVEKADKATLEKMLAEEKAGKNRASALKAIETALAAFNEAKPEVASNDTKADVSDKNAQPVPADITADQAKAAFGGWFGETDDENERLERRTFVEQIVRALGAKITDLDLMGRRKAIFYLRRKRAGMEVDFSASYDFEGSPVQAAPEASAAVSADDDLL